MPFPQPGLSSKANEDLGQFLASISHDLKEPLRTIRSFSEALVKEMEPYSDQEVNRLLAHVVTAAGRMQVLLDDAIAFAFAESCGEQRQWVDMDAVLRFALNNLESAIADSDAVVTHDRLAPVHGNFGALAEVFQNLIGNAIKYRSEETPGIHIGCASAPGDWVFSVADNGIGIRPEYAERIFLPFTRLHTQSRHPGTGLGLAICRRVVAAHGGSIWVSSKPGAGSTFYFTIPEPEPVGRV
jgi:light-regulated signal transduction histidine kinase (bacteriophytochrome)